MTLKLKQKWKTTKKKNQSEAITCNGKTYTKIDEAY